MKDGTRFLRALALGLSAALLLALGCAQDASKPDPTEALVRDPAPPADPGTLRIGTTGNYRPLSFERDGALVGLEVDFAWLLAEELDRAPVFVRSDFDTLIPRLVAGDFDVIMAGMSATPGRREQVAFTEPYMRVGQMALIRMSDVARLGRPAALLSVGTKVGYKKATTGEQFLRDNLPHDRLMAFETAEGGVAALRGARIDFFVHDAPTVWRYALAPAERQLLGLYEPLTEEYLAWAVRKEDTELRLALDAVVQNWKKDGRLRPMVDRWVPVRVEVK